MTPNSKFFEVLNVVGMDCLEESRDSLKEINRWAQKNLLRQGERWDLQTDQFEKLKPKLMPLLIELGVVQEISPRFKQYQGAIVYGAFLSRVRLRLNSLVKEWNSGVRFGDLYFLGGDRPLDPVFESEEALLQGIKTFSSLPKTENEMIQFVWAQSEIPEEMRGIRVHFISAPMKMQNGKLLRPTTEDSIEEWLKKSPLPGRYLAVSNQPYLNRFDLTIKSLAPTFSFDTIGAAAQEELQMVIFLDEIARTLFQMQKIFEK